jgi:Exonuclease VII small subunit
MSAIEKTFEQKQEELEMIVQRLEAGNAPLDEMIALYEKGASLYHDCQNMLEQYEKRIDEASKENPVC